MVAQQILIIQQAKAAKIKEFHFEGKELIYCNVRTRIRILFSIHCHITVLVEKDSPTVYVIGLLMNVYNKRYNCEGLLKYKHASEVGLENWKKKKILLIFVVEFTPVLQNPKF